MLFDNCGGGDLLVVLIIPIGGSLGLITLGSSRISQGANANLSGSTGTGLKIVPI